MEWDSPWGIGFPGWHIECSAMSLKYLGEKLDIHCGGSDHINIHHTNEIAQSEAATGKKFFNYWLHGAFLNISGGKKMAKSEGNFLSIETALVARGINPLVFRFATLQVHYRKPMEYSDASLHQAAAGFKSLLTQVASLGSQIGMVSSEYRDKFKNGLNDDLNLPKAMVVTSAVLKSKLSNPDKLATILDFDKVLGLRFDLAPNYIISEFKIEDLTDEVQVLIGAREEARKAKNWEESDRLRDEIRKKGYLIEDIKTGYKISKL